LSKHGCDKNIKPGEQRVHTINFFLVWYKKVPNTVSAVNYVTQMKAAGELPEIVHYFFPFYGRYD